MRRRMDLQHLWVRLSAENGLNIACFITPGGVTDLLFVIYETAHHRACQAMARDAQHVCVQAILASFIQTKTL